MEQDFYKTPGLFIHMCHFSTEDEKNFVLPKLSCIAFSFVMLGIEYEHLSEDLHRFLLYLIIKVLIEVGFYNFS